MRIAWKNILWAALTVTVLLILNAAVNYFENHGQAYYTRILEQVGIFVIAAVSLNIVNGFTGQFSIGHAAFLGVGAYASGALTVYWQSALLGSNYADDGVGWFRGGLVLLLAMLVGGLAAAIAGLIVGLPSLKLRGDYLAIVTLGFAQILIVIIDANPAIGGSIGFSGYWRTDPASQTQTLVSVPTLSSFFWIYLVAVGVVALSLNLRRSVHGIAMESIREDEVAAEAMGIPTTRLKVFAFVISAFFTGVAGALFVHYNPGVAPSDIDFTQSMNLVMMVVLGGLGSVSGSVIGAVVITILPESLRFVNQYRMVIYALALILMMLLRPQGMLGREELTPTLIRQRFASFMAWLGSRRRPAT